MTDDIHYVDTEGFTGWRCYTSDEIVTGNSKESVERQLYAIKNIARPFFTASSIDVSSINNLCDIVNDWATKKGWNETPDSLDHKCAQIALMHSELSECLEFVRKKVQPAMDDHVPTLTGEAAELADVLIRIFHYCGQRNINLGEAVRLKHEYNITRPYKHGKRI